MNNQSWNFSIGEESKRLRQSMTSGRIFDILRQAIIQLELLPGSVLSESEVAKQFGVSRQPVREAFIKLSEIKLLEIRPQRGTLVRLISKREVNTARFLREAIETSIVRKATETASAENIASLHANMLVHRSLKPDDYIIFHQLDEEFHQLLAKCADCEDAWHVLNNLKAQMDRVRFLALPNDVTPISLILKQHEEIVKAIESRDADAAEKALRNHLAEIQVSLPCIAQKHPDLFLD